MLQEGQKAVVLDLDGTITDPEKTEQAFSDLYTKSMAHITGIPYGRLRQEVEMQKTHILAFPEEYGVEVNGFIVSSSNDPYFLVQTATSEAMDKFLLLPPDVKTLLSAEAFANSYPFVPIHFREGAKEAIEQLQAMEGIQVFNVTNSSTKRAEGIFQKLLGDNHDVTIIGDAQKMHIDPNWRRGNMPAAVSIAGSAIPGLLQRDLYFKALYKICSGDFQQIDSVWGDNGRLDLILPQHIKTPSSRRGIHTGLIASPLTNPLEEQYFSGSENSTVIHRLREISQNIQSRRKS